MNTEYTISIVKECYKLSSINQFKVVNSEDFEELDELIEEMKATVIEEEKQAAFENGELDTFEEEVDYHI